MAVHPGTVKWRPRGSLPFWQPFSRPFNLKIDAFLFLQRSDIAHFATRQADFAGVPLLFIDPGLMDSAAQSGLDARGFEYRPLPVDAQLQSRLVYEALTRAATLDQALTKERLQLLGPAPMQGWDQGVLRLFLNRVLCARYLGEICAAAFPEGAIGVFRPTKPQQFYFDSFVATDMFAAGFNRASGNGTSRCRVIDHYDTTAHWVDGAATRCFDFAAIRRRVEAGQAHALTHIPTCYAHLPHYQAEIARAFPTSVDLPSPFWDVPVRRDAALWQAIDALPAGAVPAAAHVYRERARQIISTHLGDLLPDAGALALQAESMAAQCFVQAINYHGLRHALRGARPHFIVTDHDTGSNGPLFSVAAELGAPITVLPHSSYPTGAIPHASNVRVIERAGFATPTRSVWGEKVATLGVQLGKGTAHGAGASAMPPARSAVRTVCLLMNTMFSQGLSHIDFAGLMRFHARLVPLCARYGASVLVRLKPNGAGVTVAAQALQVSADDLHTVLRAPIAEVASLTDLCITYGEPTTAGIDFLAARCLLLHSGEQAWPSDYLTSPAYIGDGMVSSYRDAAALEHIESLLADPARYQAALAAQAQRFSQRVGNADTRIFPATPAV